jgi:hypothetical protein
MVMVVAWEEAIPLRRLGVMSARSSNFGSLSPNRNEPLSPEAFNVHPSTECLKGKNLIQLQIIATSLQPG